MAMLVERV